MAKTNRIILETIDPLEGITKRPALAVVHFYTPISAPCTTSLEIFDKLAGKYPQFVFVDVNLDAPKIRGWDPVPPIDVVPTWRLFLSGKIVGTVEGCDQAKVERAISEVDKQ